MRATRFIGSGSSAAFFELSEHELRDRLESLEDALAGRSNGLKIRHAVRVQRGAELFDRGDRGHIALIILNDEGDLIEIVALLGEVMPEVFERFDIRIHPRDL